MIQINFEIQTNRKIHFYSFICFFFNHFFLLNLSFANIILKKKKFDFIPRYKNLFIILQLLFEAHLNADLLLPF